MDVLIAPTRSIPRRKSRSRWIAASSDRPAPSAAGFTALIPAGNLAGLPALSIPCGFANGMPMGLQLVGSPFSENMLLAIGKNVSRAHGLAQAPAAGPVTTPKVPSTTFPQA